MIEMKCKSCGGNLEVSDSDFLQFGNVVIQTCATFRCPYCLSTFKRNERFDINVTINTVENMTIKSARTVVNTGGGPYIGGNVTINTPGDFVGRDSK